MELLFWNINRNDIAEHLADCLIEHDVDIAVLAEAQGLSFGKVEELLDGRYSWVWGYGGCDKVWLIAKCEVSVSVVREQGRYAIYEACVVNDRFALLCTHLQDRRNAAPAVRMVTIRDMMRDAHTWMDSAQCQDLIVMGDLNANPYDCELLQPDSFNAVLFKDVIRHDDTGSFAGKTYPRLYNPTIHFISEEGKMYGSYYRLASSEANPIWNCPDQALFSANLADKVVGYRYLRSAGDHSLMAEVRPNRNISDHLPLLVSLS